MSDIAKRWIVPSIVFPLLLASAGAGAAPEEEAQSLLRQADRARGGGLPGLVWTIELVSRDADGEQRRTLKVSAAGSDNVAEFVAPDKVKGQRLVMLGRNYWFVRPGLSKPVPISPRQRLLGQLSNGDVAATDYAGDYQARRLREERCGTGTCDVLELTAARPGVTYDRIHYWIERERRVGVRAEFYTVSGKLFKSAEFEYGNRLGWQGSDIPFVSRMLIRDAAATGAVTELRYRAVEIKALGRSTFRLD